MNTMAMASAVTAMVETTEKTTALSKAKKFLKKHKMAIAVGTTAAVGFGAGFCSCCAVVKNGMEVNKLKKKPKAASESAEEPIITEEDTPTENSTETTDHTQEVIDVEPTPIETPVEQEEEPVKEKCEKECNDKHSA